MMRRLFLIFSFCLFVPSAFAAPKWVHVLTAPARVEGRALQTMFTFNDKPQAIGLWLRLGADVADSISTWQNTKACPVCVETMYDSPWRGQHLTGWEIVADTAIDAAPETALQQWGRELERGDKNKFMRVLSYTAIGGIYAAAHVQATVHNEHICPNHPGVCTE